jgi:predicted nucleic acid-binding protein
MPVVSNTSPVLNLAIIGQLSLLQQQFGETWLPPAVISELRIDEDLPGVQAVREALTAGWMHIQAVEDVGLVEVLRRIAATLELRSIGVLGVLLRAKQEGHLPSVRETIHQLQIQAGFRIGMELLADILRESGEL